MYDTDLQKLYIGVLLADHDLFSKVRVVTKPNFFNRELQKVVTVITDYVDDFGGLPDPEYVKIKTGTEIKVPDKIDAAIRQWFLKEFPQFCLHKALEEAVVDSSRELEQGNYDTIELLVKNALQTRLITDYGLDYDDDPELRLRNILAKMGNVTTGFESVDRAVGKVSIGDLIIYAGGPGSGKSLFLQNTCITQYMVEEKNVLYITLELNPELSAQRIDAMLLERSTKELYNNISATSMAIKKQTQHVSDKGKIFKLKYFPSGTSTGEIKNFIKDFMINTGVTPDIIVLDYLDLIEPVKKISSGDTFGKDKAVTEEIRNAMQELEMTCFTASQLNRCLALDTKVDVQSKGTIDIKDIEVGDEILSNNGYNTVKGRTEPKKQYVYEIRTSRGNTVRASAMHIFPTVRGEYSMDTGLVVGDVLMSKCSALGECEADIISTITAYGIEETMDIETNGNHLFYANGILTHNSAVGQDDLDHSHIAGGISKINTADLVLGIITNTAMREKGIYELQALKVRNGEGTGRRVRLDFISRCMKIKDNPEFLNNINSNIQTNNTKTNAELSDTEKAYNEIQNELNRDSEDYNPVDIETGMVVPKELRNGMGSDKLAKLQGMILDDEKDEY